MTATPRTARTAPGAVSARAVTKVYDRATRSVNLRAATPGLAVRPALPTAALDRLDLIIEPGEAVGVIGPNGAGKSTLLKVLAGVTRITSGHLSLHGRVAPMIELGLGFHDELTGRANLRCSAALLGMTRRQIRRAEADIIEFAGIGDAIDAPLREYSTGMAARLGFAVATAVPCDLLAVDEVLAVGDYAFHERCFDRVAEMVAAGTTLVFVSHEMPLVARMCDRVVHLRAGRVVDDGPTSGVIERYLGGSPAGFEAVADPPVRITAFRNGSRVLEPWSPVVVEAELEVREPLGSLTAVVEYTAPVIMPGHAMASSRSSIHGLDRPGRYRVRGEGIEFPGESGRIRTVMTLMSPRGQEVLSRADDDLRIAGPWHYLTPHLAVEPRWQITLVDEQLDDEPRVYDRFGDDPLRVRLRSATKRYRPRHARRRAARVVPALVDVDLDVVAGSSLGIIGPNGAGKTTLLAALSSLLDLDQGTAETWGRLGSLLGLDVAFHPDFTGRQNLRLLATVLGLDGREFAAVIDEVVRVADMGDRIDDASRTYSSGMRARLGVALVLVAGPELLLIDEVLSVGDASFRKDAIARIRTLRQSGSTLLFVSHSLDLVAQVCDVAVRMTHGEIVDAGATDGVVERYGGPTWASSASSGVGEIIVSDLTLDRHVVASGDTVHFAGVIRVVAPSPTAWVEVSYRGRLEEGEDLERLESLRRSFLNSVVEPPGGALARAGTHRFSGSIDRNHLNGEFDLVVTVVDDGGTGATQVVTERWSPVRVGNPALGLMADLDMVWTVERLADEATGPAAATGT